ncbi:ABC transporter substrate-binding protein [Ammoniphilus oxalaticus]|uniref:ABC transporter substrate-binding protein n=1 Tax=Ammoniphilus oxalaticus TaxID=66863 RepID=A0A419SKU0_9BACL|nr:ABC transporter substrate-binding protein [Ammoniphilus oxalaticus]RKD24528.1 ABC transporter substrate-binding protein [Ammoniphilus oxalaticus]
MFKHCIKNLLVTSLLAMFILLTACGTRADENTQQPRPEQTSQSEQRVKTDALGHPVAIPNHPQRIIASYLEDHLIALGITPIAQWSVKNGQSIQNYLQEYLAGVDTIPHDLPLETVSQFEPDLIIIGSAAAVEGGKYEQYSKIAPTYVVAQETNENWRETLRRIAVLMELEQQAEQVLTAYDEKADKNKALLHEAIGDESAAVIWLTGGNFFIVSENVSSGDVLYHDLGLSVPKVVEEISRVATGNWSAVSLEKLATLDADHLFLINSDSGDGAEWLQDPLWKNIPAVKKGNVYEYGSEKSWLYSGAIANEQIMDAVLKSLIK